MISKKYLCKVLRDSLEKADPNQVPYPAIKRKRIMYPIGRFQHFLKIIAGTYKQILDVSFIFDEETISKELTVCILKTDHMRLRLTFDHHDDSVLIFVVGRDFDGITKKVNLHSVVEEVEEFFSNEPVEPPVKPVDEPKKVVVKKKIIVRKKASPKPS